MFGWGGPYLREGGSCRDARRVTTNVVDVGFKGGLEAVQCASIEIGGAPGRVAEKHKLDREARRVPVIGARAARRVLGWYEVEVVCWNGG
jgi:hypothetical protein